MKLCFVASERWSVDILRGDTRAAGGAEAQIAYLAMTFAHLGHSVDLIYGDEEDSTKACDIAGVRCVNAFPTWNRPGSLLRFWQVLKESDADLVYARLPSDFLWVVGLFSKLHPKSRFMYALANDRDCNPWRTYTYKTWLHDPLYALGLRAADIVAVQHEAQARSVSRYVRGTLVLVPNLVRPVAQEVRNCDETDVDVIWIAQIRPQKQLSVLLDIAEELPHLQFAVVGGFDDSRSCSSLEQRTMSLKNLSYSGPLGHKDVMRLLARSKVLANTSYWEGFPNTMLEAWSLGIPVVSLQIDPGGVIRREGLGLVSGSPAQMVRDIMKLVEERSLNYEMGKRGQEYVRRAHSIGAVCRAFEQVVTGFQGQSDAVREGVA